MLISFFLFVFPAIALVSGVLYLPYLLWSRRRSGKRSLGFYLVRYALLGCCLSLLYLTVLWYYPDITFFPEYRLWNLRPFVWLTECYAMGPWKMAEQLLLNIGMFVPYGLLLPLVFPGLRHFPKTALAVLATTVSIETLQFFIGRSADIDDVIMNLAGGMLGYAVFALLNRRLAPHPWWQRTLDCGA